MEPLFDVEYVTENFANIKDVRHYFNLIQNATGVELISFRRQVIVHKNNILKSSANHGRQALLEHGYIISAINHELLKRSWRYKVYKFVFPFRQWLVKTFSNLDLIEDDLQGSMYITNSDQMSMWHLSHKELLEVIKRSFSHLITTQGIIALTGIGLFIMAVLAYIRGE